MVKEANAEGNQENEKKSFLVFCSNFLTSSDLLILTFSLSFAHHPKRAFWLGDISIGMPGDTLALQGYP